MDHIMDHKDKIRTSNDVTCFHPMDNKYWCSTTCSHIMYYKNHKLLFYNLLPYNGLQTITNWKRLFLHLHVTLMEFFNVSPIIALKIDINSIKEKREKRRKIEPGGICYTQYSSIYIIPLHGWSHSTDAI